MPPKGTKSPRTKSPKNAKGTGAAVTWETSVITTSVNEENWNTFVCFLTPDRSINQIYVDLIEKAMQNSVRRRFDLISKRDLLEAIKSLGKPSKNAAKSVSTGSTLASLTNSAFFTAYEHAKTILDTGGDIDDQLWAKLIKCRILDLKKDVQARTTRKPAPTQPVAGTGKPEKPKSPGGKKSPKPAADKKKSPAGQVPAADTHIEKSTGVKTRDQITDETKYIDDELASGPNQYIFLSGFYSIGILNGLNDVGILIDTITNVSCDSINETKRLFEEMFQRERQEQTLKADLLKEIHKDSISTPEQIAEQNNQNDQILNNFWTNLMPLLDNAPDRAMLQDVIVTTLKVPNDDVPDSWVNTEQRIKLAQQLYDNIVQNSFRLNIRKRQFNTFNQQMKVVDIPTIEEQALETVSDAKIYNEITTLIPPESMSVPLILHSILEQVEAQTEHATNHPLTSNQQDDVGRYLHEKLMTLSMGRDQQKEMEKLVPKAPFSKTMTSGPTMVYYGDETKQRLTTLNRLAALDPMKIEHDFLMSHSRLVNLPELIGKRFDDVDTRERQARLNQFLQFCTSEELLLSDVDHILKQFIFECMSLNSTEASENPPEQPTSRPSSAGSDHEDGELSFERQLSTINDEEKKHSANSQPIVWDDPFETLVVHERTGRIGISAENFPTSPSDRSSKMSILRTRAQSPKRPVFTVRFDVNNPDNNLYQQMSHLMPPIGGPQIDGNVQNIAESHKRNLNDWNFAEHFEPDVFAQIVEQALFTHSHIDVYYNRRDQSHMMVLSLPVPEGKTIGYENTSKKLFSDVGFRNFLDEISYEIVDWLRDEEAKYQADVLAKEVQSYAREPTPTLDTIKAAAAAIEGAGKKGKGAAGKKTPPVRSPSLTSDSGNSTDEEKAIRDDYVHPTSLKAWKQKKDKEIQEQDQQAKAKRPQSGSRSAKAKSPKGEKGGKSPAPREKSPKAAEKAAKPATPREKSPKGGKSKRPTSATPSEKAAAAKATQETDEPIERFIGYGLGNRLLSAQCNTSHLLLPDGCLVRTRIDTLKRGSTTVSTSLYRNKSSYKVQLINPHKTANEQKLSADDNPEKRVADYGVFTALFNSGMILSCSNYDTKAPKAEVPPEPVVPEVPPEEKVEDKKKEAATAKGKKKGKTAEVEAPPVEKPPPEPVYEADPFQRVTISIPTGLVITYYPDTFLGVKPTQEHQPHKLLVKQYYPYPSKGFHTCEQSRLNAYEESSRIIDAEGHVIIFKRNGEVTVLQPDGGIFTKTIIYKNEAEVEVASESPHSAKKDQRSESKGKKKGDSKHEADASTVNEEVKPNVYQWKCITADGQVSIQNPTTQEYEKVDQLRLILETNPKTTEQVIHREDKVIIVFRSDGSRVVSFADGTRITSYEAVENKGSTPSDQETGERNNSMLGFRKIPHVKVEASGYATVAFNCQTTDCRTVFNDGSSIDVFANGTYSIFESDGEKFDINDNGDVLFDFQQSTYGKRIQELLSNIEPSKCLMSQNGDVLFDAIDYEQTQYCVEASGEAYSKDNGQERKGPLEMHMPRFFIVHEDGSGTELLRFKDLYTYLRTMDLDPSTAVVREPLLSNPKVTGATVMRPFQDEVHRRWLTSFEDDSIVPASLRNYTSVTAMTRSYSSMSGSNNSSSNYLTNQENAILRQAGKTNQQPFKSTTVATGLSGQQAILEMPKALDYRSFMEFPRLHDDVRMKLFTSLKAYMDFVKNRADYHSKLLPRDHRSRQEKERANKIWKNVRPQGNTKDDLALLYLKTVHPDRQRNAAHQSVAPLAKKFNIDHLHDELQQEKLNKRLRQEMNRGIAVPYFKSEWGMAYTEQQQHQQQQRQETEHVSARGSRSAGVTKSMDGHENFVKAPSHTISIDPHNRLSQLRKSQPTRSASTEVEDNKTFGGSGQHDPEGTYRPVKQFVSPRTHLQYDAVGNKRAHPIKIPTGLKGSRPNAQPHARFLDMEEPVMVRPNNASIGTSVINNRPLRERRGCELYPDRIDFGILKEGVTYGAEIEIKNVGIDACRFRIRQPPLGTGLRVVFQPGMLAAGMRRPVLIELYAIIQQNRYQQQQPSQGLYQLEQSIEIITETDIMHFPIRAKIATEEQFDVMFVNKDETAGMSKSIRLLARKSSNVNDWLDNAQENSMVVGNEG